MTYDVQRLLPSPSEFSRDLAVGILIYGATLQLTQTTPNSLPTAVNTSTAWSISVAECAADI